VGDTGRNSWLGASLLLAALAVPGPARAADARAGGVALSGAEFAHWAHPDHVATVRRSPSRSSGRVGRIHLRTEDGFPEVYVILRAVDDAQGRRWLRIRIPKRPKSRTGWVRDSALGPLYRVETRLDVDRVRLRATLYRSGKRIWRSAIGVGKAGTPTPAGRFWIREKFTVATSFAMYGPRAFGTSAYARLSDWLGGGVVGIHGTDQPSLIPGRPSHGCVRVPNRAIKRLYRLMPIGTPMRVR
jgi:hypothetical protein